MTKLIVLIGGSGSNLQAIIDAINNKSLNAQISAVISHNPDVKGLIRAQKHNIPCATIDHRKFKLREDFDHALSQVIEPYQPDWLVLAGFMRILTYKFISKFRGKNSQHPPVTFTKISRAKYL